MKINEKNLHVYSTDFVRQNGMNVVMDDIEQKLKTMGINHVHVSIDIDGIDPTIVKGTGTKVNKGMGNGEFYTFIDRIFDTKKVRATDFVEYNPMLDDGDTSTLKWCVEAIHYLGVKINQL